MTKARPHIRQKRPEGHKTTSREETPQIEEFILSEVHGLKYVAYSAQHGFDVKIDSKNLGGLETQVRFFSTDNPSLSVAYRDPTESDRFVVYQSDDFVESVFKRGGYSTGAIKEWLFRGFIRSAVNRVKEKLSDLESRVQIQGSRIDLQIKSPKYGRIDLTIKQKDDKYLVQAVDYYSKAGKKKKVYAYEPL